MSNQSDKKAIIYLFIFTALIMLSMTNTSPMLRGANVGIDSSVFISVGRAMASGKIMYKEIFGDYKIVCVNEKTIKTED